MIEGRLTWRLAVAAACLGACGAAATAAAQPARPPKVGVLMLSVAPTSAIFDAFRQGLRQQGYTEGESLALEVRFAQGQPERLPLLAAELVRMKVAVIVTESVLAARAPRQATADIPIVTAIHGDPVGAGLATSLARPGGNVTGLSLLAPELSGKRLELLKQAAPRMAQVAVIWNPENPAAPAAFAETKAAAHKLGLQLHPAEARSPREVERALESLRGTSRSASGSRPSSRTASSRTRAG